MKSLLILSIVSIAMHSGQSNQPACDLTNTSDIEISALDLRADTALMERYDQFLTEPHFSASPLRDA